MRSGKPTVSAFIRRARTNTCSSGGRKRRSRRTRRCSYHCVASRSTCCGCTSKATRSPALNSAKKRSRAFFDENDLSFERHTDGPFEVFSGTGKAEGIKLLAGDFFALTADHCCDVSAVYDRASLIAMNDDLRPQYAQQLAAILPAGSISLLLVIDYDTSKMQGPPFPVPAPMVTKLFTKNFDIQELAHYLSLIHISEPTRPY